MYTHKQYGLAFMVSNLDRKILFATVVTADGIRVDFNLFEEGAESTVPLWFGQIPSLPSYDISRWGREKRR